MGERLRGSRRLRRWTISRSGRTIQIVAGSVALVAAFGLGRHTAPPGTPLPVQTWSTSSQLAPVQNSDPRELIPLPIPGQPGGQGQQLPGQEGQGQCPLYFFQDGQFFELRPGESGPLGQGNPELFPLEPAPGNPAPAPPAPPEQPESPEPPPPFFRNPGVAQGPVPVPQPIAGLPTRSPDPETRLIVSTSSFQGR